MRVQILLLPALLLSACIQPMQSAQAREPGPIPDQFEISGWDVKCWDASSDDHVCSMERILTGLGFFRLVFDDREVQLYRAKCQPQDDAIEQSFVRRDADPSFSRELYNAMYSAVNECNGSLPHELDNTHNLIDLLLRATN